MKKINLLIISLALPLLLNSCGNEKRFKIQPKSSDERVEVKIKRFDKDLINLDVKNLNKSVDELYKRYPDFLSLYVTNILDADYRNKSEVGNMLKQFVTSKDFRQVNNKVMETFSDVTDIEEELSDAFTYIHHYFPEAKLPEVYFFVSGFNRSVMMTDNFIAAGTDFYLGSDYEPYKEFTYKYLMYNMRRECVSVDLVSAILFRLFTMDSAQERLLDNMVYRGKVMYLLSVFMPDRQPEDLMGYTPEQWKWCNTYEKEIWGAIIDQKDLFSTDQELVRRYMNDAPFTASISQESPGRLGTWVGWQIVKSYMARNEKISLRDLMKENNCQKILEQSGYRP